MEYLSCFRWVSGKIDLSLYSSIPFVYTSCTLPKACQEIKVGPHIIFLGLAKLFKLIPHCIQAKVFFSQAPGLILVHAKAPTPSYYLLALLAFWECCKFTLKYVLTFKPPFQESMVWTIIYCPVHRGAFYIWHVHGLRIRSWSLWVDCVKCHLCLWFLFWACTFFMVTRPLHFFIWQCRRLCLRLNFWDLGPLVLLMPFTCQASCNLDFKF